jgi:hypothetical protein
LGDPRPAHFDVSRGFVNACDSCPIIGSRRNQNP